MYTPKFNQVTDRAILFEAMRTWSFAILFGPSFDGTPNATHLPLVLHDEGDFGILEGHFALANPHWRSLANKDVLTVFSGPHAYVSPSLYENKKSVPTWNYIAVHATGMLELQADDPDPAITHANKEALLKNLIRATEPDYESQWDTQPPAYKISMTAGIQGFRIPITRLEGKFKISQNRPPIDRQTIQQAHSQGTPDQQSLAEWMKRLHEA